MALAGKVYIVTGASRGFGLAITKSLLAAGASVGMLSRDPQVLEQAVADLDSPHAFGVAADVGRKAEVQQAFTRIAQHFGRVDGVINNAGMARPGSVENLDEAEVLMQINTNLLGTIFCCQLAIPLLRDIANARIINFSSASAYHVDEMRHLSVYAATKAAIERFSRDLRIEAQEVGIGVTCIRPGAAWTSFADGWNQATLKTAFDAWHRIGPYMDSGMESQHVADAVLHVLGYPAGVAIELLEIRPNVPIDKLRL